MKDETKRLVAVVCKADDSITDEMLGRAYRALSGADVREGQDNRNGHDKLNLLERYGVPRVLGTDETRKILRCSKKTIYNLVKRGKLVAVYGGAGGLRATGYSSSSVFAYADGIVN